LIGNVAGTLRVRCHQMDRLVCIFRAISAIVNPEQVVGVANWESGVSAYASMVMVGCLSVAVLDLWQRLAHRLGGLPPTNWAVVGRWLLMLLRQGILFNPGLAQAPSLPRERLIGWVFHYVIGVVYVWVYVTLWQPNWGLDNPLTDGLLFGAISTVVPRFFFIPATGAGLFGSRTPRPVFVSLSALVVHAIFGSAIGLFSVLL
jgi:hypothetical protein